MNAVPKLVQVDGYWERAAKLRSQLLKKKKKARAMDCLVTQSCLDHNVGLIAEDKDFRHFRNYGLQLA